MAFFVIPILFLVVLYGILRFSIFIPPTKGLPVLMYHNIDASLPVDHLNVLPTAFENQLKYLINEGYTSIGLSDLCAFIHHNNPLPAKPVLITFDDGYKNNFTQMYPMLCKYNCRANIFLVNTFIDDGSNERDISRYLTVDEINRMKPSVIEYGLHSFSHTDYNKLDEDGINDDVIRSKKHWLDLKINMQPCFAYTYGSYPKKDETKKQMLFKVLKTNDIIAAFRIGNRVNKLPVENTLLMKRIDIRGTDTLFEFGIKLRKGRSKLF